MSYDGRCEHGTYVHPFPDRPWVNCTRCMVQRDAALTNIVAGIGNLTSRRDSEKDVLAGLILSNLVILTTCMYRAEDGVWRAKPGEVNARPLWEDILNLTAKYRRL